MSSDDAGLMALRDTVRHFLSAEYTADTRRRLLNDPVGHDPKIWRLLSEQLGLTGLRIPEVYGGAGASAAAQQIVFEELGAALYCGPLFACAGLAAPALLSAADERAKARFLPQIADGSLIATLATTEPGRDWDLSDIAAEATAGGPTGWTVSGSKVFVVDAAAADLLLVSARAPHGIGLFAVERGTSGYSVIPQPAFDLTRRLSRVVLDAVPAMLLSGDRDVLSELTTARCHTQIALTAEQVGVASAALQMAADYAQTRRQFDRPIGQFQAMKHLCAEMLVDLESAASLACALALSADTSSNLTLPAALAKAMCSDVAFSVAARMIQVHGGVGFTWEHDAHLYYRRAKSSELMFGDASWQRRQIDHILDG